jgi:3-oxoacyl-[acyl-carrier protein] reductase
MSDRYQQFANSSVGRVVSKQLGLPRPQPLKRHEPSQPELIGPVLVGAASPGRVAKQVFEILSATTAEVYVTSSQHVVDSASQTGLAPTVFDPSRDASFGSLVFDASDIESTDGLSDVYEFLNSALARLNSCGRVVVFATPPSDCESVSQAVAQRALEGLVRSVGKELRRGATAQLVYVSLGAETNIESTVRFLLSAKSAYVSGQVVSIGLGEARRPEQWDRPLEGKVALVTGASRGIGKAIAHLLSRDGAHVVCLDVPAQQEALGQTAAEVSGSELALDMADSDTPRALASHLSDQHGGCDIVVHNAGITRDKTIARMTDDQWDAVISVNLASQQRVNEALIAEDVLRDGGRIVCVSSVSGIAGNRGQANYATSKAGVIGLVDAMAPVLSKQEATINAVAPGFIETQMTEAMPMVTREAGRRMNSLAQGGQPIDVAETISWLASPASGGINGNVIRVCGQSMLGA